MKSKLMRAAIATIAAGIVFAQPASAALNLAPYMKAQHLVDIGGGRHLNLYCAGTGSPTVVLDLGQGVPSIYNWRTIQPELAATTRVCSYERAGYGFSDAGPLPRDASAIVGDLHALLHRGNIPGPYVFVGHSSGATYARLYADRYRPEVAGLVLIDPDEDDAGAFDKIYSKAKSDAAKAQYERLLRHCAQEAHAHQMSLARGDCGRRDPSQPSALHAMNMHLFFNPGFWDAWLSEFTSGDIDLRELRDEQRDYGRLPMVVLMAGNSEDDAKDEIGATNAQVARAKALDVKLHAEDAANSGIGMSCLVPGVGHFIHLEKPNAVIDAVLDVVREARQGAQSKPSPCHYT